MRPIYDSAYLQRYDMCIGKTGVESNMKEQKKFLTYNNLGMYHIQSKQKSRLFKTLICSECDTAGLYQVA